MFEKEDLVDIEFLKDMLRNKTNEPEKNEPTDEELLAQSLDQVSDALSVILSD